MGVKLIGIPDLQIHFVSTHFVGLKICHFTRARVEGSTMKTVHWHFRQRVRPFIAQWQTTKCCHGCLLPGENCVGTQHGERGRAFKFRHSITVCRFKRHENRTKEIITTKEIGTDYYGAYTDCSMPFCVC